MRMFVMATFIGMVGSAAWATPFLGDVSGLAADGNEVIISGSDFGANELDIGSLAGAYNVVESTPDGQSPPNTDGWIFDFGVAMDPVASSTHSRSGTKSVKCSRPVGAAGSNSAFWYDYGSFMGLNTTLYLTWWTRASWNGDAGQWKQLRIRKDRDVNDIGTEAALFNRIHSSCTWHLRPGPGYADDDSEIDNVCTNLENTWYRLEVIAIMSSDYGQSDGTFYMRRYIPNQTLAEISESGMMMFNDPPNTWRYIEWQNWRVAQLAPMDVYIDDPYVQLGTQARVELCDSARWNERTACDIQPPTTWSEHSITVDFNQGVFSNGQIAYLYVVDSNGVANSSGHEVTIGSGQNAPPIISSNMDAVLTCE